MQLSGTKQKVSGSACGHMAAGHVRRRSDHALQSRFQLRSPNRTVGPASFATVITPDSVATGPRPHPCGSRRTFLRPHFRTRLRPAGGSSLPVPLRKQRLIPRCVRVLRKQFRHSGTFLFAGSVLLSLGGTSHRSAAARPGSVRVLLERNPPNRPLAPVGSPASRRESNPAPHKTKKELYALQIRSNRIANQERRQHEAPGQDTPPRPHQSCRVGKRVRQQEVLQRDLQPNLPGRGPELPRHRQLRA